MNWKPILRLVCHQRPERSYIICNEALFVCSRCLGIYVGFLFSFIILIALNGFFTKGISIFYVLLFVVPMAIDGLTQLFGFRTSINPLRFITGYLAGFSTACIFYSIIAKLLGIQLNGFLPNLTSFSSFILLAIFLAALEKFNNKENIFLKKFFNFVAVLSAIFLMAAVVVLYLFVFVRFLQR